MFFVLSGFVLSLRHFRKSPASEFQQFSYLEFGIARFFRIVPAFWVVLAISAVLQRQMLAHHGWGSFATKLAGEQFWSESISLPSLFRQFTFRSVPWVQALAPQYWTLSTELILSLLVPIAVLIAIRNTGWLFFFCIFALGALGVNPFLFHFVAGVLIAKHQPALAALLGAPWSRRAVLLIGILLYTMKNTLRSWAGVDLADGFVWYASGLGSVLILLYALSSVKTQGLLSSKLARFIGRISYSVYLLHVLVVVSVTRLGLHAIGALGRLSGGTWFAGLAFTLLVTILFAWLSYCCLERPGIALGKALSGMVRRRRTALSLGRTSEKTVESMARIGAEQRW